MLTAGAIMTTDIVTTRANVSVEAAIDTLLSEEISGLPVTDDDGRSIRDLQQQEFTNVEDENRSSVQARLARQVLGGWAIEGRVAVWRNLAGSAMDLSFKRELVYLGLIYGR